MTPTHDLLVDEIFAGLVEDRQLPTTSLADAFRRGRFVSAHYPSGGTVGSIAGSVPPDFPQFKGKLGAGDQVWFERLYLDPSRASRHYLETRPSGAWIHVNRSIGQEEAGKLVGSPVRDIIERRPLPEELRVLGVSDTSFGSYGQSRLEITPPRRVRLPRVDSNVSASTVVENATGSGAAVGGITDDFGVVHLDLASYLCRTHRRVPAWEVEGRDWKRNGIRIPGRDVAHVDIVLHETPGVAGAIPAISVSSPYDRDRAYAIGRQDGTFFDRRRSAWMIPLSVPAHTAGRILNIWQLLALPDGTFLQAMTE